MAIITRLQIQKNNQDRVNVFLDGEYAFAVSLTRAQTLEKGRELSVQEVEALRAEGDVDLAYQRSLRYLARRPRSRQEMVDYLTRKGYDEVTVETTIARLEERSYVDDDAFAAYWVDQRNRFRPRGAQALRHELRQKGVAREVIEDAVESQDDDAAAWAALAPKLSRGFGSERQEFLQKAMAYLARRGFRYEAARRAAERAWAEWSGEE
jgi:regulatory protein